MSITGTGAVNISTTLSGLRPRLEPGREKLGLHIRRGWSPAEIAALDDLPGALVTKVDAWLAP
jgi:hypothetical protein